MLIDQVRKLFSDGEHDKNASVLIHCSADDWNALGALAEAEKGSEDGDAVLDVIANVSSATMQGAKSTVQLRAGDWMRLHLMGNGNKAADEAAALAAEEAAKEAEAVAAAAEAKVAADQ